MNFMHTILLSVIILPSMMLCSDPVCPNKTLIENCQYNAENDWDIDRNKKDSDNKDWCCHQWQAIECQVDLGNKCKEGTWDKTTFNVQMNATRINLVKECPNWPQDKCTGLKWWAITLIVIGVLLAVALVGFLVFVLLVRKKYHGRHTVPK